MSHQSLKATPEYNHVYQYPDVYEPAEDTFLLMDALEKDLDFLFKLNPQICLEVGCGSGLVSVFLSKLLNDDCFVICTDINPMACQCTKETALKNNVLNLNVINMSLTSNLLPRIQKQVDVVIFNPPYVVTPSEEILISGITQSWAGGKNGREVIDVFIESVPQLLSNKGVFYLLLEKQNKPEEIISKMDLLKFNYEVVKEIRAGPELLSIIKFYRKLL